MNTKKITNLDSNDRKRDMDRFAIACNLYGEEDRGNAKKSTAPAAMRDAGNFNFYDVCKADAHFEARTLRRS